MIQKLKTLFLIDGFGGLGTGVTLGFIVPLFPDHIGIPLEILYTMSAYGFLCGAYSLFWSFNKNIRIQALKPIIIANTTYCIFSLGLMIYYFKSLSILGLSYFTLEKFIILSLVYWEIKTLRGRI